MEQKIILAMAKSDNVYWFVVKCFVVSKNAGYEKFVEFEKMSILTFGSMMCYYLSNEVQRWIEQHLKRYIVKVQAVLIKNKLWTLSKIQKNDLSYSEKLFGNMKFILENDKSQSAVDAIVKAFNSFVDVKWLVRLWVIVVKDLSLSCHQICRKKLKMQ